jgi:hypothetical protein
MGIRGAISAAAASTLLTAVGFIAAPAPALAYERCNEIDATASVKPSSGPGGAKVTLTVKLTNCQKEDRDEEERESEAEKERERQQGRDGHGDGSPAANQLVNFSQESGPRNCHVTFSAPLGTTNAKGIVTVTVTLPPNCPGTYQLLAKGSGFSVEAAVREKGGFFPGGGDGGNAGSRAHNESFIATDPGRPESPPVVPLVLVGAGLALVAAGGAGFIRRPRPKSS